MQTLIETYYYRTSDSGHMHREARIVTNNPEAVQLGEKDHSEERSPRSESRSWKKTTETVQVTVDEEKLGHNGWVALVRKTDRKDGVFRNEGEFVEPLLGEPPHLLSDEAYEEWVELVEGDAVEYLHQYVADKPHKVRRSLSFAAGEVAYGCAPHAQRRKAWYGCLRKLGLSPEDAAEVRDSHMDVATIRAAQKLGWKPSEPEPDEWEGLPEGVTELPLD